MGYCVGFEAVNRGAMERRVNDAEPTVALWRSEA